MAKHFANELWELQVGDLCLFTGPLDVYTRMKHRMVYRVVGKESTSDIGWSRHSYAYREAFDLADRWAHPMAVPGEVTKLGTNHMVRLDLVDLCRLRLDLDVFIVERTRELSTGLSEG